MPGFRSLESGEAVEFRSKESERGWEATVVTGPGSGDCKGSTVRPLGKKKFKKIRYSFNCHSSRFTQKFNKIVAYSREEVLLGPTEVFDLIQERENSNV